MKVTREYYLKCRNFFIINGFFDQVKELDVHFGIILIYDKKGQLISVK